MRSTHTCTPSFRTLSSQYSRRLLSILAQLKYSKAKKTKKILSLRIFSFFALSIIYNICKRSLTKSTIKKMRSTHACTPTFALSLSIFTSVVVYSRTTIIIGAKNKQRELFLLLFNVPR